MSSYSTRSSHLRDDTASNENDSNETSSIIDESNNFTDTVY
jgi:hypothetical protein